MVIHGLCTFFASNSRFMRLFPAALDTPLDSPFSTTLSVHGLHFMLYAPSIRGGQNVQQLTCKMVWSFFFLFSFPLFELKQK